MFHDKVILTRDGLDDAVAYLSGKEGVYTPEGFDDALVVILERKSVRASLWDLSPKAPIAQTALEIADEDGRGYFLISDENMQGASSIFLCAVSINDTAIEAQADVAYIVKSWMRSGCPKILIGGYADKTHGGTVHIVAAQLASLL